MTWQEFQKPTEYRKQATASVSNNGKRLYLSRDTSRMLGEATKGRDCLLYHDEQGRIGIFLLPDGHDRENAVPLMCFRSGQYAFHCPAFLEQLGYTSGTKFDAISTNNMVVLTPRQ